MDGHFKEGVLNKDPFIFKIHFSLHLSAGTASTIHRMKLQK